MNLYLASLLVSLALFAIIFGVAISQKNYHFINAFWGLGFVAISLFSLAYRLGGFVQGNTWFVPEECGVQSLRYIDTCTSRLPSALSGEWQTYWPALVASCLVTIWGVRLSWHILMRNRTRSGRYKADIRASWPQKNQIRLFLQLALSEAFLLWIVSLPLQYLFTLEFGGDMYIHSLLLMPVGIGVAVWLSGYIIEVYSDRQLHDFTGSPGNKGKVMSQGLWKYSRHPNYFGEATMWWGIFLITLASPQPQWLFILSPLLVTYMLRYVSGVPVLEKRYEAVAAYQRYKKRTNTMIPWPPKKA